MVKSKRDVLTEIRQRVWKLHKLTKQFIDFDEAHEPYNNIENEYSALTERWEEISTNKKRTIHLFSCPVYGKFPKDDEPCQCVEQ